MLKKSLSLVFIGVLMFAANLQTILAQSNPVSTVERNRIEKLKTEVYRFGLGQQAMVAVKLKNGTKLKGYISQTIEDSFDLTDPKTKQFTTISYDEVAEVKKQGSSRGIRMALGLGIVATIIVLTVIKRERNSGGFCPLGCGPF